MDLGMVGLGRMGGNMADRLRAAGHTVVGFDHAPGRRDVHSLRELADRLARPRAVWVMVPAGEATDETLTALGDLLAPGDVVVDGGNSRWTDSQRHAADLAARGIRFLDAGVSGGVWGREDGYALMVGGDPDTVRRLQPVFEALKPPGDAGFVHAGPVGAGHFAKMVHNGIEYGLMQAYAEGYELLAAHPALVTDVEGVVASWREGTVIRSWLLDLLVRALEEDAHLTELRGYVQDSGEGRWTVQSAIAAAVPLPVITAAVYARFVSRQDDSPAMRVVAALRNQFGGHAILRAEGSPELGADAPGADTEPLPGEGRSGDARQG
ncbi:MAG: phosphogluconate dehydrogenase (NAD(+)-dependent, decarboxylating) [Mycobacterium leprae]